MAKKFLPLLLSFFSLVSILVAVPPMWEWRTGYEESSKRTTPTVYSSISPSTEPLVDEFTESRTESCSGPSGDLSPERVRRGSGIFKSIPKLHVTDDHDADDALEESTISRQELLDQSEAFVKDCFIGEREEAIKKFEELSSLKNTLCNEICNNTENLLKKIDDVKIKSEEAIHLWEEAVENTQMIRTIFEGYKAVCEKMQDPSEAEKISEQIQFYEAKLLEYEAESQAAETLHHARSNQSSQSSASIQTSSDSNKNELTRNFFMATVNFEKAAAAYREMKKGDEDGEVADFYSLMARWCDARALEQQIFSQLHCAEIYNQHYAFTDLEKSVEKLFVAYNDFVSHCEILSDELSNEPLFQEEKNEVDKYCAAAVKRRAGLIDSVQISEKAFHQDCALYAALRHGLLFEEIEMLLPDSAEFPCSSSIAADHWDKFLVDVQAQKSKLEQARAAAEKKGSINQLTRILEAQRTWREASQKSFFSQERFESSYKNPSLRDSLFENACRDHQETINKALTYQSLLPAETDEYFKVDHHISQLRGVIHDNQLSLVIIEAGKKIAEAENMRRNALSSGYDQAHQLLGEAITKTIEAGFCVQTEMNKIEAQLTERAEKYLPQSADNIRHRANKEIEACNKKINSYQEIKNNLKRTCWESICKSLADWFQSLKSCFHWMACCS